MDFYHILVYAASFFGIFSATLFFMLFFDESNRKRFSAKTPKNLPSISIIIPAYNSEKGVERSIKNALSLDYPREKLEVIVVDDGSTDKTYEIASTFEKKGVKIFHIPHSGKGKALNVGISNSKGELIANLDADSFLDKDALLKMVGFFDKPEVMAVTPSIKIFNPDTIAQKVQFFEFLLSSIVKKAFSYLGAMPIATGASTLFRKQFFEKHGGYHEHIIAEDGEVSLRIAKEGYLIEHAMDVAVHTSGLKTFKGFFNQRLRWSKGLFDCLLIHKSLFHPKHGNIAIMVLPLMLVSILLSLVVVGYSLFTFAKTFIQNIHNFYLVGFDTNSILDFSFDIYNVNVSETVILPIMLLLTSFFLIYLCKRYSKEQHTILHPYFLFFLTYWFISASSSVMAILYKLLGKKIKWGDRYL